MAHGLPLVLFTPLQVAFGDAKKAFAGHSVIHDGRGVVRTKRDLRFSQNLRGGIPWAINVTIRQQIEFGDPAPHISAVGVKLFSL